MGETRSYNSTDLQCQPVCLLRAIFVSKFMRETRKSGLKKFTYNYIAKVIVATKDNKTCGQTYIAEYKQMIYIQIDKQNTNRGQRYRLRNIIKLLRPSYYDVVDRGIGISCQSLSQGRLVLQILYAVSRTIPKPTIPYRRLVVYYNYEFIAIRVLAWMALGNNLMG